MFDITAYAGIRRLLDAVENVADSLRPNELETYRELAVKYAEPLQPDATDSICLEVILRNVEIRKAYRPEPECGPDRVIEPVRKRRSRRRQQD